METELTKIAKQLARRAQRLEDTAKALSARSDDLEQIMPRYRRKSDRITDPGLLRQLRLNRLERQQRFYDSSESVVKERRQ
jgi:DNA repair exonuclease SbcCD ATPase subunit